MNVEPCLGALIDIGIQQDQPWPHQANTNEADGNAFTPRKIFAAFPNGAIEPTETFKKRQEPFIPHKLFEYRVARALAASQTHHQYAA